MVLVTIQAKLLDDKNVQCLDSANWIRFGLAGDGELIDNQGTSSGSRYVQLYNGRAVIKIKTKIGKSVVSAKVDSSSNGIYKSLVHDEIQINLSCCDQFCFLFSGSATTNKY